MECENAALLKLFLFYVFDIVLAYTIAGSFLSKLQQLTQLLGALEKSSSSVRCFFVCFTL